MKTGRRLALPVVLGLLVATPVALAMAVDPFGPVEVVDPGGRPGELIYGAPLIGVDGAGNALWAGYARDSESGDDQMAVFERCGTTWVRSLLGSPQENWLGMGLEVAPDGTAMAVWRGDDAGGAGTFYSAVRPPSGAWGAPQVIVARTGSRACGSSSPTTAPRSRSGPTVTGRTRAFGPRVARGAPGRRW